MCRLAKTANVLPLCSHDVDPFTNCWMPSAVQKAHLHFCALIVSWCTKHQSQLERPTLRSPPEKHQVVMIHIDRFFEDPCRLSRNIEQLPLKNSRLYSGSICSVGNCFIDQNLPGLNCLVFLLCLWFDTNWTASLRFSHWIKAALVRMRH